MKSLLHTLTVMAVVLLTMACSKDEERSESYTHSQYELVTYVGTDAKTGNAQYDLVGRDLTGSTMLQGNIAPAKDLKPQQRVMLRFNYADDAAGAAWRQVKVFGVTSVHTDSLRSPSIFWFEMHPVKMISLWRTGDFINLHCQVEYIEKPRTLMLLIDNDTRYQDTAQLYLNHDLRNNDAYFWRGCYASFNVGNVWKRTQCKTIRIHINDNDAGEQCYDFDRL